MLKASRRGRSPSLALAPIDDWTVAQSKQSRLDQIALRSGTRRASASPAGPHRCLCSSQHAACVSTSPIRTSGNRSGATIRRRALHERGELIGPSWRVAGSNWWISTRCLIRETDALMFARLSRGSLRRAMITPGVREFDAATIVWRTEQGDLAGISAGLRCALCLRLVFTRSKHMKRSQLHLGPWTRSSILG